jgi:glycyl-tRNA synthetase beta chain
MADLRTAAPDAYTALATAFKRAWNIAKDAPPGDVDPSKLVEPAEKELFARFGAVRGQIDAAAEKGEYGPALRLVATELRAPVDEFFVKVFVMAEDPAVRDNRLRLLRALADSLNRIAHFHLLGG